MESAIINIYKFDELSKENQSKMIDKYRDFNTDGFTDLAGENIIDVLEQYKEKGFVVSYKNVDYDIYGGQGSGVSFVGEIDLEKYIAAYYPNERNYNRIAKIDGLRFTFERINRHYSHAYTVKTEIDTQNTDLCYRDCENINAVLDELQENIERQRITICKEIEKNLENLYDLLVSDESIKETLIENDYDFSIDSNCFGIFNN